ncbi:uncharacterized protein LOC109844648 [Asparagus officinalis]|uniref:uncharacterized protein LOC109844648 n=1 Tax=Asparagus officinalis TaxID=4686 RepID=UPI00098E828E|nr:uncharacterized protein LOC109844648 [Asparagus officinalis]
MHEIHDGDMIVKMDDTHDILKMVESDIAHIDVIPIEEKDKIESDAIDGMCELFGGGLETKEVKDLCMEYDASFSSLEAKIVNNFKVMILSTLEYEKQHGTYFEELFKSIADPHAVRHITMVCERFIQEFESE